MANMSYCRFTNTRRDMDDCLEALEEEKRLSDFEVRAGKNMFQDILEFRQTQGVINIRPSGRYPGDRHYAHSRY